MKKKKRKIITEGGCGGGGSFFAEIFTRGELEQEKKKAYAKGYKAGRKRVGRKTKQIGEMIKKGNKTRIAEMRSESPYIKIWSKNT